MYNLETIVAVPVIMVIALGAMNIYKGIFTGVKARGYIPMIAAMLGAILGMVAFYAAPAVIPAPNVLAALLIGGFSGWSATGAYETFKKKKAFGALSGEK